MINTNLNKIQIVQAAKTGTFYIVFNENILREEILQEIKENPAVLEPYQKTTFPLTCLIACRKDNLLKEFEDKGIVFAPQRYYILASEPKESVKREYYLSKTGRRMERYVRGTTYIPLEFVTSTSAYLYLCARGIDIGVLTNHQISSTFYVMSREKRLENIALLFELCPDLMDGSKTSISKVEVTKRKKALPLQ